MYALEAYKANACNGISRSASCPEMASLHESHSVLCKTQQFAFATPQVANQALLWFQEADLALEWTLAWVAMESTSSQLWSGRYSGVQLSPCCQA